MADETEREALAPCASCGGDAERSTRGALYIVQCKDRFTGCGMNARTHRFPTPELADAAWNRRSPASLLRASDDWRNDPSADERWSAGCDYAIAQLAIVLGTEPSAFSWDAATETLDGDVQAIIGNALVAGLGEDWQDRPDAASLLRAWEMGRDAAATACVAVADTYPDLPDDRPVATRALVRQSANVARLCAKRIRALTPDLMQRAGDVGEETRRALASLRDRGIEPTMASDALHDLMRGNGPDVQRGLAEDIAHVREQIDHQPAHVRNRLEGQFKVGEPSSGERRAPGSPRPDGAVEVCPICDIAGCRHLREREALNDYRRALDEDEPPADFGKLPPEWENSIVAEDERREREIAAKDAECAALQAEVGRLRAALAQIKANRYGLQGIIEDHSHDTNAYNYHAMKYFRDTAFDYQQIARRALAGSQEGEDRDGD